MLGRLRIGPKLLLAPGVVLILLVLLSCGAYSALLRQNRSLETIVLHRAAHIRAAAELVSDAHHAHTQIYQLLTWISASFSASRVDALVADLHRRHQQTTRRFAALLKATQDGSAERRFVEQAEAAHGLYVKAVLDVIELSQADPSMSANAMWKAERAFEVVALRLYELACLERELSERASARAAADFRTIQLLMPVVIGASVILSLLITMAVRRALLREVRDIGEAAHGLAMGDLTVGPRSYGSDEISETSRALDVSIRGLNATLRGILESARTIGSASRDIALGKAGLDERSAAHAGTLGAAASTLAALELAAGRNASSVLTANRLAASASGLASEGGEVVEQLVLTMDTLKGSSRKVVDIVGVIDRIAEQTSVLALNVAVEAARAGDGGSGLAAVAGQVHLLAQCSSDAARDIRALVVASVAEIEGGSASASVAGDRMAGIAVAVAQVGALIDQVSQANARQASGLGSVGEAIVQVDQMSQQNSALVAQAAAAAAGLQEQAHSLFRAVAAFKLDESVQGPPELPPPAGGKARLRLASKRG